MTTPIKATDARHLPSAESSQTLVEYLRIVEPPPMPGPRPVSILDVLISVYDEPDPKIETNSSDDSHEIEIIDTSTEKAESDEINVDAPAVRSSSRAFSLVRLAAILSITGWLLLIGFLSSFGALFFFCLEGLALTLAIASFSHPRDCPEIRPLRIISFALSVGWIPVVFLFLFEGTAIAVFLFIAIVCFLAIKVRAVTKEDPDSLIGTE